MSGIVISQNKESAMRVEHLAIDGSVITIEADADLTTQATATGWAIVPSLMQTHPFTISPAGHSAIVEKTARSNFREVSFLAAEDFSLKGGSLRIVEVEVPTATGRNRTLTIGGWEGQTGCLVTSLVGSERDRLIEVFDTLHFREDARGLAIDSPVTRQPRAPEVIKEIPELGVLSIRPAIHSELERIPRSRGHVTNYGEYFRVRPSSHALAFMSKSAVVSINPLERSDTRVMLAVAQNLRIEWTPRRTSVPQSRRR
jgi:hypothetical protein